MIAGYPAISFSGGKRGKLQKEKGERDLGKYIIKRILLAVMTVLIICAITFFTMHAVPGGPFNRERP